MKKQNNTVKISKLLMICIVFLFAIIGLKLLYTAYTHKSGSVNLKEFANKRDIVKTTLYAKRGSIFDINSEILAQNVNSYTVIAYLSSSRTSNMSNPKHVVDKKTTASKLASIINMTEEDILKILNMKIKQCSKSDPNDCDYVTPYQVELGPGGRGITELTKEAIEKLELPGIGFIQSQKRSYQNGDFASYLIGYAKKNETGELVGEMGIESYYNDNLKGKNGSIEYQRDAYGYKIPNTPENVEEAVAGSNIYLTIDSTIQLKLESAVKDISDTYNLDWITLTIANAKTGAILGSASNPSFNPNTLDIEKYLIPLTQYTYEPGSTMKVFSFMAAMENGIYNGEDKYQSGTIKVQDATIKDFNNVGWGSITYDEGFIYSSNVAATKLALKLGKTKLRNYYSLLGFGKKTGIELPGEATGKITFNYETELATASFGQGITVTPIQYIQALTALGNDGIMVKPYLVEKIVDVNNNKVTYQHEKEELAKVSSIETVTKMKELMYNSVYNGITDAKFFKTDNIVLIGKTGTAQIASGGKYLTGKYDYIRSFAGLFPYEDPEYIVYVSVKQLVGPYKAVGNLVSGIVEDIANYKNITIKDNEIKEATKLKNYINKRTIVSTEELNNLGLKPIVIGDGNIIVNQYPNKDNLVVKGSLILLLTNSNNYLMPNIIGWSNSEIKNYCEFMNLKCSFEGYGYVTKSSILKETKINRGDSLLINLEDKYGKYLNKNNTANQKES